MFDLRRYIEDRILALNVKSVSNIDLDTYTDDRFFSCRAAYHQGEQDFGGHLACISLKRTDMPKFL